MVEDSEPEILTPAARAQIEVDAYRDLVAGCGAVEVCARPGTIFRNLTMAANRAAAALALAGVDAPIQLPALDDAGGASAAIPRGRAVDVGTFVSFDNAVFLDAHAGNVEAMGAALAGASVAGGAG